MHGPTVAVQLKTLTTIDICYEGRRLWALAPSGNDLVLADISPGTTAVSTVEEDECDNSTAVQTKPFFKRLHGHLHRVSACVYRRNYQQVS